MSTLLTKEEFVELTLQMPAGLVVRTGHVGNAYVYVVLRAQRALWSRTDFVLPPEIHFRGRKWIRHDNPGWYGTNDSDQLHCRTQFLMKEEDDT